MNARARGECLTTNATSSISDGVSTDGRKLSLLPASAAGADLSVITGGAVHALIIQAVPAAGRCWESDFVRKEKLQVSVEETAPSAQRPCRPELQPSTDLGFMPQSHFPY